MNRIRLWLLGLAMLAVVTGGSAGWPDVVDAAGGTAAAAASIAVSATGPGLQAGRGQRWH